MPAFLPRSFVLAFAALLVTACGGGGDGGSPPAPAASQPIAAAPVSRLVVAGDSLADVGTFGLKATVQAAASPAGYPVFPEVVGSGLGFAGQCNFFSSADEGDTFSTNAGCSNFAVASAAIVNPVTRGGDDEPFSVKQQLETALAANGGAWGSGDLVVIDAGANDVAGLADAYVDVQRGGAAEDAVFLAYLGQQLSGSEVVDALSRSDGGSVAARQYMQRLARTHWDTVKANTLDKGATRVELVNIPDITFTPRFRSIAAGLAVEQGAQAGADFQAALRSWIAAFNTELAQLAAGDSRVAIVVYFADFTADNQAPSAFGLANTDAAACGALDFAQCTDAALDASPPAGGAAGWWKTWLYSDPFHPTPRGHELLGESVLAAIARAGWR
jgi:phospholipase/lecithinase/hemolysin